MTKAQVPQGADHHDREEGWVVDRARLAEPFAKVADFSRSLAAVNTRFVPRLCTASKAIQAPGHRGTASHCAPSSTRRGQGTTKVALLPPTRKSITKGDLLHPNPLRLGQA